MNELQIFNNSDFGVIRTAEENGKVLFCGSDVAKALGYAKPANAVAMHCKGVTLKQGNDNLGRQQQMSFITEGDLYRLIVNSKLPNAEKFERWVFDDVLPTIRKHGMYATDELVNNPDLLIQIATTLKEERAKNKALETSVAIKTQQISELQPKANYYDLVLNCKDLLSTTKIAKDYGKSAVWLNDYLHDKGVQFKQGDIWLLYQKYAEKGYTSTKTHSYTKEGGEIGAKVHTYWTQKGRLFIYEQLKADGIIPVIER